MTATIKTLFSLQLALVLLAGCKGGAGNDPRSTAASTEKTSPTPTQAESRKTGYLSKGDIDAAFVQLVKVDRQIKGQMQYFGLKQNGETVTGSLSFDGVSDGENISLTFRDKYLRFVEGQMVTGTLRGDSLILFVPQSGGTLWTQEFHSASVAEYNDAVRKLRGRSKEIIAGGVNPGTSKIPDDSEYGRQIQMILGRNFNPPPTNDAGEARYVIIQLRIARDGRILSLVNGQIPPNYFKRRSSNGLVNNAVVRAVLAASNDGLPPFPNGFLMGAQEAVAEIWFRYPK